MRLPDVIQSSREEIEEAEKNFVLGVLGKQLSTSTGPRAQKEKALAADLVIELKPFQPLLKKSKKLMWTTQEEIRSRMEKAVAEIKESVDENRFEQELIYYLEKYDITEEKVRLHNHLTYFVDTLNNAQSSREKLGFIAQEIGRRVIL